MKRRTKIRWISYGAALLVILAAGLVACHVGAGGYVTRINANTSHAMGEVLSAVEELDTSLKKSAYATTPAMESAICTQIYSDAQTAEMAIGVLPVQSNALEEISRHISVVGDYAYALSRAAAAGHTFSEDTLSNLSAFSQTTSALYEQLSALQQALTAGAMEPEKYARLTDALDNLETEAEQAADTMDAELQTLAETFPTTPALIYDGKYTDRTGETANMLSGKSEVTEEEARARAAEFLQCDEAALQSAGRLEGEIPCWNFDLADGDDTVSIAVTVQGGEVLRFYSSCVSGDATIDHDAAQQAAADFLAARGFEGMEPYGYESRGGAETIRFLARQDGVWCYPDMVSVTVCMETGNVLAMEAKEYLKSHAQRDLSALLSGEDTTAAAIPTTVQVLDTRPVVLASLGGEERLCREYTCAAADGSQCRIYVNAETGEQEKILLADEREDSELWT